MIKAMDDRADGKCWDPSSKWQRPTRDGIEIFETRDR